VPPLVWVVNVKSRVVTLTASQRPAKIEAKNSQQVIQ